MAFEGTIAHSVDVVCQPGATALLGLPDIGKSIFQAETRPDRLCIKSKELFGCSVAVSRVPVPTSKLCECHASEQQITTQCVATLRSGVGIGR